MTQDNTLQQKIKAIPVIEIKSFADGMPAAADINYERFLKSVMDQKKDYPLPVPLVKLFNGDLETPLITLKSFSLWQGKQKSKKTTLLAMVIASFITGSRSNDKIRFECAMEGVVLVFDNEQGESYAARTMKLILKLAGLETSVRLVYCDLREYSPADRMKIIEAGIQNTPNVRLVIIDGLVDLLTDFMDAAEGHMSITNIIKLCSTYDIHVAGVLHQNKADKNARAHVGTISSQKCEIEISTEVDPNDSTQSLVECVNSRGMPFEKFAIKWEKGSLPVIVQDWSTGTMAEEKAAKNRDEIETMAKSVFKPLAAVRQADAVEGLMNISMKSESTAKRHLRNLLIWGIVEKGPDGLYRINIKGSRVHEGSNEGS